MTLHVAMATLWTLVAAFELIAGAAGPLFWCSMLSASIWWATA